MMYKKIFLGLLKGKDFKGTLEIKTKGERYSFGDGPKVTMIVRDAFFRRVILSGDIGFGEAFIYGDLMTDDLKGILKWFVDNKASLPGFAAGKRADPLYELGKFMAKAAHMLAKNTRGGSKRNIRYHYDISNRFYELWLDPTMTYSCAVFSGNMTLRQAQENKYRMICEKAGIRKDDHVLEIGTGWGGFSIYAAKHHGCKVTTITISKKQYRYARENIRRQKLEDRITLKLQDYRDIKGHYDKIVSIEMMEALGHEYVPRFIKKCARSLRPQGRMCLQAITFPDRHFKEYLKSQDFIKKHIFPGGELLSTRQIKNEAERNGLEVIGIEQIGKDYAKTLNHWRKRFVRKKEAVLALGFDERFYRKWLYYFIYCEVGFETGYIDDAQIIIEKKRMDKRMMEGIRRTS